MVLSGLLFTHAGDGLPKGSKALKAKPKRKSKKPAGSVTPEISGRETPASNAVTEHGSIPEADLAGDRDGTPLYFTDDEEAARPAAKTPVHAGKLATDPIVLARDNGVASTVEAPAPPAGASPDEDGDAIILDLSATERECHRDTTTGMKRELWRPGDGDGDKHGDYYDRPGPALPLKKRWRLYQLPSSNGPVSLKNLPPKFVVLDDRAAYEVLKSDIPRTNTVTNWPHDFGGAGKIRARRPHRGRPAIADPDAEGNARYHSVRVGTKNETYYFTGEKDYKPRIFRGAAPTPAPEPGVMPAESESKKRKASSQPGSERDPKKHGHNQHTPKEELVKYGAPTFAKGRERYRHRINTWLRRSPSPQWARDRSKLYGGIGDQARAFTASMTLQNAVDDTITAAPPAGTPAPAHPASVRTVEPTEEIEESIWADQDDQDREQYIVKDDFAPFASAAAIHDEDNSSDAEFPFARRSQAAHISGGGGPSKAASSAETPLRKRLPKPMSYLERMAAEQEDASGQTLSPGAKTPKANDCGSSMTNLERQLASASTTIEELNGALASAQMRIEELEGEMSALQHHLAGRETARSTELRLA